ncbi:MAG: hypothetical protein HZC41_06175 [Chloroflexi bacterium]|nr:hypothetical protein [Chloroflexota bacterium]
MLKTDWVQYFLPAIELLLRGVDPYQSVYIVNPPWTFFMLAPVGLLPHSLAVVIGAVLPVLALVYAAWKVRKPYLIAIVGLTFPFIYLCVYGNLDWMVLLGVLGANSLSPFLLTVKPQAGALVLVSLLGRLKGKSWQAYARVFGPFLVIGSLLLLLFPGFMGYLTTFNVRLAEVATFSLFPYTLPLVPPLLWLAYRRADPLYGTLASLCISPYFLFWSVVPTLFLIASRNWKWGIIANLLTWVVVALVLLDVITFQF